MTSTYSTSTDLGEGLIVREAREADLVEINRIYNRYVLETPITFDIAPTSMEWRHSWFQQFSNDGPYRLVVAEENDQIAGYAGTIQFRKKAAYSTTVETTIYVDPNYQGKRVGQALYLSLFELMGDVGVHKAFAGVTLPNAASVALHEKMGFRLAGVFPEVGRKFDRYWDVAWYELSIDMAAKNRE